MVWPRGTRGGVEKRSGTGCTKPRTPQIPLSVVRSRKVKLHSHFIMQNIPVGRIIKIKLWRTYLLSLGPDSRLLLLEVNLMASGVSRPPVDLDEFPDVSKLDLRVVTFSDFFSHTLFGVSKPDCFLGTLRRQLWKSRASLFIYRNFTGNNNFIIYPNRKIFLKEIHSNT